MKFYETTQGSCVNSDDLLRAFYFVSGKTVDENNPEYQEFVRKCFDTSIVEEVPCNYKELLYRGYKIAAIKLYRFNNKGAGLVESKNAVEDMMKLFAEHVDDDVKSLLRYGLKLNAIRLYRTIHEVEYDEARNAVNEMEAAMAAENAATA